MSLGLAHQYTNFGTRWWCIKY